MRADKPLEVVATGQAYATRQPNATPAEVAAADELTVHDQTIGIYDDDEETA